MSLLGEIGFKKLARLNHERACQLSDRLAKIKAIKQPNKTFFNEFVLELPVAASDAINKLAARGIIGGYAVGGNTLLVAATEMTSKEDIEAFATNLEEICAGNARKEVA